MNWSHWFISFVLNLLLTPLLRVLSKDARNAKEAKDLRDELSNFAIVNEEALTLSSDEQNNRNMYLAFYQFYIDLSHTWTSSYYDWPYELRDYVIWKWTVVTATDFYFYVDSRDDHQNLYYEIMTAGRPSTNYGERWLDSLVGMEYQDLKRFLSNFGQYLHDFYVTLSYKVLTEIDGYNENVVSNPTEDDVVNLINRHISRIPDEDRERYLSSMEMFDLDQFWYLRIIHGKQKYRSNTRYFLYAIFPKYHYQKHWLFYMCRTW